MAAQIMLPDDPEDSPLMARVTAAQHLLFPSTPRAICEQLGLNWWAALKLFEDGWLDFSPEDALVLDEAQEAELRFVGSLVVGGCDRDMLSSLLSNLPKPYAYHPNRLYYDWGARRWRLLPDPKPNPEAVFADWLDGLVERDDMGSLTGILELARDALARVRLKTAQQIFHAPPPPSGDGGQKSPLDDW